jgi:hypothetical protein
MFGQTIATANATVNGAVQNSERHVFSTDSPSRNGKNPFGRVISRDDHYVRPESVVDTVA